MSTLISFIFVIVGALNWLSISLFQFDLVAGIFGSQADTFSRIIYGLVGFSALWLIYAAIRFRGILNVRGSTYTDEQLLSTNRTESARINDRIDRMNDRNKY